MGFPLNKPDTFKKVIEKNSAYWQLGWKGGSNNGGDSGPYTGRHGEIGNYTLSHSKAATFNDMLYDI